MRRAEQQALTNAKNAWASIQADLNMCTQLPRDERGQCITTTNHWLETARSMEVTLPASIETVDTDCGKREVPFDQTKRSVAASDVPAAERLLTRLRQADVNQAPSRTLYESGARNRGSFGRTRNASADDKEVFLLYEKACNENKAASCTKLGGAFQHGRLGLRQDYSKAVQLYIKACEGGDAAGCANLGLMYQYGKGVTKDANRSKTLYRRACLTGYKTACSWL